MHNYPLLNLFWTMLWFFLWILWIFLLVRVYGDIFRSSDLSGPAKAVWLIVILVLPYIGIFVYLIMRGSSMHLREADRAQASEQAFRDYIGHAAAPDVADQLAKLAALRDQGVITDAELATQKARLLASS